MERKKHKIDATDKILGRLAADVAVLLRGKNKVNFVPHIDNGDFVEITNFDKIKITGKKLEDKIYYKPTGYVGNMKSRTLKKYLETKPSELFKKVVYGMLPKNRTRDVVITRLKVN